MLGEAKTLHLIDFLRISSFPSVDILSSRDGFGEHFASAGDRPPDFCISMQYPTWRADHFDLRSL
jgi:hypothetical protein